MIDLSRWINPTTVLTTEAEAHAAGRAGAAGAWLQAANGLLGALVIALDVDGYLALMRRTTAAIYGEGSEMGQAGLAMMTPAMVYFTIATSVVAALVYVVLGWVQWRKPNVVIPLLLGLLTAYGLLTMLLSVLNGKVAQIQTPAWQLFLSIVVGLVSLVFFYNGFRGADRLSKLRREAVV
jgi:hypothetical protein